VKSSQRNERVKERFGFAFQSSCTKKPKGFVCPPKAIKIIPPGPAGRLADRSNAEKMPQEFEINMLRCIFCGFCQEVCPEEAIFLQKDYSLTGLTRAEMIYDKEKLLALGGTVGGVQKWKHKLEEAKEQDTFPVKV